jgi:hypothetical protein
LGQQSLFYPLAYPYNFYIVYSEEEEVEAIFKEEDKVKQVSEKYGIKNWISINSFVTLSLTDWLYLDPYVKRAIVHEVNEIAQKQESDMRAKKQEAEMLKAELNSSLKFMTPPTYTANYLK